MPKAEPRDPFSKRIRCESKMREKKNISIYTADGAEKRKTASRPPVLLLLWLAERNENNFHLKMYIFLSLRF
jgi:hypothetical protein